MNNFKRIWERALQCLDKKEIHLINEIDNKRKVVVSFTGGLGNQILSASVYYLYELQGYEVFADLSYFDFSYKTAPVGGGVSHWGWELDGLGIQKKDFRGIVNIDRSIPVLRDGATKVSMSFKALCFDEIKSRFKRAALSHEIECTKYLCVHIRRGDYLNVASHLVEDNYFDDVAPKFRHLVERLVIVSDSPVNLKNFKKISEAYYDRVLILDDAPVHVTHSLMRNANILICSNSQFSLSAGLLSGNLVLLPKKWFGGDQKLIEDVIGGFSDFTCLNNS